jgi:hypothetical protein
VVLLEGPSATCVDQVLHSAGTRLDLDEVME